MQSATVGLIKSKAVRDGLTGAVMGLILGRGLTVAYARQREGLGLVEFDAMYRAHLERSYVQQLRESVSGPIVVMALTHPTDAISEWRWLMGPTQARDATAWQVRYLGRDEPIVADNVVHGSDSVAAAQIEGRLLLPPKVFDAIFGDAA